MSYSVCSGRDVNFHARKLKYAAKEQLSAASVSCKTLFGEIDKSWNDYAQKVSKNSAWVFFQLFRSNFDLPIPLVNAPFARRVVEINASQAKVTRQTVLFDPTNWSQSINWTQLGYLIKFVFLHFQTPLPEWIFKLHQAMFHVRVAPSEDNESGGVKRTRETTPESIIWHLDRIDVEHVCKITPASFGNFVKMLFEEAFGETTFKKEGPGPEPNSLQWDNLRLYISAFERSVTDWGPQSITAPKEAETKTEQESTTAIDSDDEDEDAAHFAAKYKSSSTPVGAGCLSILIDLISHSSDIHFELSSRLLDPS